MAAMQQGIVGRQPVQRRFSVEASEEFDRSKGGKRLVGSLFLISLCLMRPFHTFTALQSLWIVKYPTGKHSVDLALVVYVTGPLLFFHSFLLLSGLSRRLSYDTKFVLPITCVVGLAAFLAAMLLGKPKEEDFRAGFHVVGLVSALTQAILDPAQYEFSGLLPSKMGSLAVQAGSGASAVCVSASHWGLQYLLFGSGKLTPEHQKVLANTFTGVVWGTCVVMNLTSIVTYILFVQYQRAFRVWMHPFEGESDEPPTLRATLHALRCVWPAALAQALTYGMTHLVSMYFVFYGAMFCPSDVNNHGVIFAMNLGDFLGKAERCTLRWGARRIRSCRQALVLSLSRALLLLVLLYLTLGYNTWVIASLVFFAGVTNGWLSTICFMNAPKALPEGVSVAVMEQASGWLVAGMYLGGSIGIYGGYVVATWWIYGCW